MSDEDLEKVIHRAVDEARQKFEVVTERLESKIELVAEGVVHIASPEGHQGDEEAALLRLGHDVVDVLPERRVELRPGVWSSFAFKDGCSGIIGHRPQGRDRLDDIESSLEAVAHITVHVLGSQPAQ